MWQDCFHFLSSNIPLHVYTTFLYPFIHCWTFRLFPYLIYYRISIIVLQWTWECSYLFKIPISIPLDIFPEVELLDHTVDLYLIFWGTSILFSIVVVPFYIPPVVYKNSILDFQNQWITQDVTMTLMSTCGVMNTTGKIRVLHIYDIWVNTIFSLLMKPYSSKTMSR